MVWEFLPGIGVLELDGYEGVRVVYLSLLLNTLRLRSFILPTVGPLKCNV